MPSQALTPGERHGAFMGRSVPGLDEAALAHHRRLHWQVYGGEQHIRHLLPATVVAVCEVSWEGHVELVVGNVTEATTRGRWILQPAEQIMQGH